MNFATSSHSLQARHRRALPAALGALLLAGVPAAAREEDRPTFEETARVVEVQVPVQVVAKGGEPIRGLTAQDFQVYDEGELRPLTAFRVVDLDVIEPGETRTEIERAVPAAARRHFLLLFDLSFSQPTAVLKARDAALDLVLNAVHPTDLVAVATHSVESGLKLIVTFTPDRAQAARAIETLGAPRLLHLARRDPLSFLVDDPLRNSFEATRDLVGDAPGEGPAAGLQQSVLAHLRIIGEQMVRVERMFARGRISSWSRSMGAVARLLDSVQGRKQVVYFSEGFDGRLLLGREPDPFDREEQVDRHSLEFGEYWMVDSDDIYGNTSLQGDVAQMLEEFRRAGCVIQAVDISSLTAGIREEFRAFRAGREALFYVANETGGRLFSDAADFGDQLRQVLERSTVTYLLAFQPDDIEMDGSYRRLKVKVTADLPRGADVSYRQGYYAPRPFPQLHPIERNLLASDAIASAAPQEDLAVDVLVAPFRASETEAYVPVIVEVSGRSLLTGHERDQLPVEFYAYVTDERGEMRDFFSQLVTIDLARNRRPVLEATGLKYYGHLTLAPGEHLIRVLVRNAETGRTGVRAVELSIPAFGEAEPALLPPFFLESPGRWFLVRESRGDDAYRRTVVYPFTLNGEPFIPAARPVLGPREEVELCLVAYNLGEGEVSVAGKILTSDGREVEAAGLEVVERTVTGIDGLDKLRATFRADGLEEGTYTLQVAVMDTANGARRTSSIPFVVAR